jgi:preprotein translocase subunit SecG
MGQTSRFPLYTVRSMYFVAVVLYVIVCLLLLVVVLLQQGKGGDIAAAFGGSSSQTAFGARTGATVLTRATTVLGALFMVGAFALGVMSKGGGSSVVSGLDAPPPSATSVPLPLTGLPTPTATATPTATGTPAPAATPAKTPAPTTTPSPARGSGS